MRTRPDGVGKKILSKNFRFHMKVFKANSRKRHERCLQWFCKKFLRRVEIVLCAMRQREKVFWTFQYMSGTANAFFCKRKKYSVEELLQTSQKNPRFFANSLRKSHLVIKQRLLQTGKNIYWCIILGHPLRRLQSVGKTTAAARVLLQYHNDGSLSGM